MDTSVFCSEKLKKRSASAVVIKLLPEPLLMSLLCGGRECGSALGPVDPVSLRGSPLGLRWVQWL